jgi:hypothetical protein
VTSVGCTWRYRTPEGVEVDCAGLKDHRNLSHFHRDANGEVDVVWKEGDRGAWQEPPAGHPRSGSDITPNGDTRLRWLQVRLEGGVGAKTRDAARRILATREPGNAIHAELVEALHLMVDETERWRDAWSSEHVDKDRQVRRAMARSTDCEVHGEILRDLEDRLDAAHKSHDNAEAARLVLLGWYQACQTFIDAARLKKGLGEDYPPSASIIDWMMKQLPKVHAAHQRVWTRSTTPERKTAGNDDQS